MLGQVLGNVQHVQMSFCNERLASHYHDELLLRPNNADLYKQPTNYKRHQRQAIFMANMYGLHLSIKDEESFHYVVSI